MFDYYPKLLHDLKCDLIEAKNVMKEYNKRYEALKLIKKNKGIVDITNMSEDDLNAIIDYKTLKSTYEYYKKGYNEIKEEIYNLWKNY